MKKEIDKPEEPPRIAVKFANTVFVLGIFYSILLIFYAIYRIYDQPEPVSSVFYIIIILCGGVFAALFGLGLKRLGNNLKVNLSLLFFTTGIVVLGFETYLVLTSQRVILTKLMGVPYDTRTYMEVVNDLGDSGVETFPNSYPFRFIWSNGLTAKKDRIYPLGTISNSTTVPNTKESGYYSIIETDEHGFNNPKGLYIENKVDIVLTGDSLTEGYTVHSNENIGAVLRQLDFNTINIGKGGNGPLLELAALKEYAEPLKPKIVLWLYFVNDLKDLEFEMKSSILIKYLDEDDYSQKLISRQEEIDDVLIEYIQVERKKVSKKQRERKKVRVNKKIIELLKLSELRRMFSLTPTLIPSPIFKDILQKTNKMVSRWGGKMYIVYLPAFERYLTGNDHPNRDFVMSTATELDIPIIDIHTEVFDTHPDPFSLFPFRLHGHYNAEGYRLVAKVIGKRLEADNYVPIKSKK